MHEEPVESLGQVGGTVPGGQRWVLPLQERGLVPDGLPDVLVVLPRG